MARDTCRLPTCDREPGADESERDYDGRRYCSWRHEIKYEHIEADARDAMMADKREAEARQKKRDARPSGPPY